MQYQSARHKRLMRESEFALEEAASNTTTQASRVAKQVLNDSKILSLWEARHASMLLPVAEHRKRDLQLMQLRKIETQVTHRSSLFNYIRAHSIKGVQRDRLFATFHGVRDPVDAILSEHRTYLLAESSQLSADHLIGLMHDTASLEMIELYQNAYASWFSLFCFTAMSHDSVMADAVKVAMREARARADRLRLRLLTQRPESGFSNFDREAQFAASGRHKVLSYYNI